MPPILVFFLFCVFIGSGIDFYINNRGYREALRAAKKRRRLASSVSVFRSRPFC